MRWKYRIAVWAPALAVAVLGLLVLQGRVSPDQASALLTFGTALVATLFLLVYSVIGKWWKTPEGRTVFGLVAVFAGTTDYIVTALIWGPYLGRDLVRLAIWAGAFLTCYWILALMIRRQRQAGRDRAAARAAAAQAISEGRW